MSRAPRILISAGEASGDRLGAGLARALLAVRPDVELLGMGGDEMLSAGVRIVQHASETAVVGFLEVVSHLPALRRAMGCLESAIRDQRPDMVVPVDFPDFNLRLAARARHLGRPVTYYVSPQVWAWRRGRVRQIRELVRRMLVLFPFEVSFYERAGVPVTFVGHPAAGDQRAAPGRAEARHRLGLEPLRRALALLPGSRQGEVARVFPVMLEAVRLVRSQVPDVVVLVPRARTLPDGFLEDAVRSSGQDDVRVTPAGSYGDVLAACDAGAVTSGTATLDAAVAGLPMVVAYRIHPLSYALARRLVRIDHIALPNLVAGRRLVPELVQAECAPGPMAGHLLTLLRDPERAAAIRAELLRVRESLAGSGAFERAAAAVLAEAGAEGPV